MVSMALSTKTIQRHVARVREVTHVVLLIDVDQDIPVSPAEGVRVLMDRSDGPVLGPGSLGQARTSMLARVSTARL